MTSKSYFELNPEAVSAFNRRAESVQRAAAAILGVPVPLVVFDENSQVPPGHQSVKGFVENTVFGVAMTPSEIKIHPRELIELADLTAQRHPGLPNQELLRRVDSQVWNVLVRITIEEPAQGREDFDGLVGQIFSAAFNDWAAIKYGVSLSNKTRDRG